MSKYVYTVSYILVLYIPMYIESKSNGLPNNVIKRYIQVMNSYFLEGKHKF